MAGENIMPLSPMRMRSCDWTATANGSRGDWVQIGQVFNGGPVTNAFLLDDVLKGGVVAVAYECELAEVPKPSGETWTAGCWVFRNAQGHFNNNNPATGFTITPPWTGNQISQRSSQQMRAGWRIGTVHHDAASTDTRAVINWEGSGK